MGGMLAEVHSQAENNFLQSMLQHGKCKYIQNSNVAKTSLHVELIGVTHIIEMRDRELRPQFIL